MTQTQTILTTTGAGGGGAARAGGRGAARPGFSFTEVLFAVMVLGIGFIMIAAMFPVTLRQTQTTMEETHAANVGRGALTYVQSLATDELFPVTVPGGATPDPTKAAQVASIKGADAFRLTALTTDAGQGNFVATGNQRLGWTMLYRRGVDTDGHGGVAPQAYAQVFLIPMQVRNRSQYFAPSPGRKYSDLVAPSNGTVPTFEPRKTTVSLTYDSAGGTGRMTLDAAGIQVAASGAYVVIASDGKGKGVTSNGRVYQLGNSIDSEGGVWALNPGSDMIRRGGADDDADLSSATAYIVGKGYGSLEPGATDPVTFEGPAQDIGLYVGFVRIPPKKVTGTIIGGPAGI